MDISRLSALLVVIYGTLCAMTSAMSLPSSQLKDSASALESSENVGLDEGRRASWLETRDLESDFKDLVLLTLQELAQEGRIDPRVLVDEPMVNSLDTKEKRGRWQGFCFKRTKTGRFLPYICWKGDRK